MKKIVFGHKSPDTDSICSAIVYSMMQKEIKREATPYRLGELNKETQYILDFLNIKVPKLLEKLKGDENIVLVDHNEFTQSIDGIQEANVVEVYDHHRIANFQTKTPITINVLPVGCTSTVLYTKCISENINITKDMARLMLSAIISDTLLFKSPTCTKKDVEAAKKLEIISELDMKDYGMNMLKAGTDLGDFSTDYLLDMDKKEFKTKNGKYEVGQVNTADIKEIINKRDQDIIDTITKRVKTNNLDAFLFIITDIINSNSLAYVIGKNSEKIAEDFGSDLKDNKMDLPGVVSRKKQIVPFL